MKNIINCFLLLLCCSASLCIAQDAEKPPPLSEEEILARQKQIQLMNDRLINKIPQFSMSGELERIKGDQYAINGEPFIINTDTTVQGELKKGANAEVRGFLRLGQPKIAAQVIVLAPPEGDRKISIQKSTQNTQTLERSGLPHIDK